MRNFGEVRYNQPHCGSGWSEVCALHLLLGLGLWLLAPCPSDAAPAELIFINGKIATVDANDSIVEGLAVEQGRVVRVGTSREVLELRGETTRVVDLQGKLLIPGLIDSHVHPGSASMHEFDHPVPDMETVADVLEYVRSRTQAVPEGQWIWVNQIFITRLREQRYPTREELDKIAPKHPVVFSTGPDAMVNSLALSLSGIDKDFVVTGAGLIDRDPNTNEPTGLLRGGTKRYLKSASPPSRATEDDRIERLHALLRDYNAVGITTIVDRDAGAGDISRYAALRSKNRLPTRVAISHSVDASQDLDKVLEAIRTVANHPLTTADPQLRIVGIKTYLDGGMLTGSALMREPWGVSSIYRIDDPEYRGVRFIPSEKLTAIVREAVANKLQFTAHSVGDGAVHALLDAYAEVNRDLPIRDTRPCITHCNFMSAEAIDSMVKLGVVADIQPVWLYLDARTLHAQFGNERLRFFQPLKSIFQAGAIAGGGSDHMQKVGSLRAINPYNPFLGMATAVTRRAKWFEGALHAEQALTRAQALRFYTRNNAYIAFLDKEVGSLEVGKLGDCVILDRDILTCPDDEIRNTTAIATFVGGKLAAGSLDGLLKQ